MMKSHILLVFYLLIILENASCQSETSDFTVTDLTVVEKNESSILFSWTLPIDQNYSSLVFNYLVLDDESSLNVSLSKEATRYQIDNLVPGSTVTIVVYTLASSSSLLASSAQLTAISKVEMVKSAEITSITSTTIQLVVDPPGSYYSQLLTYCIMKQEESDENGHETWSYAPRGNNILQCEYLESGYYVQILILTVKSDSYIEEEFSEDAYVLMAQTALGSTTPTSTALSGSSVLFSWDEISGSYGHIDLEIRLISTTASLYYVNSSIPRPQCLVNNNRSVIWFKSINSTNSVPGVKYSNGNYEVLLTNLCPMSNYDATLTISKPQFNSSVVYTPIRTSYENSECVHLTSKTVGNSTTLSWPRSTMQINYYIVRINYLNGTSVLNMNVSGTYHYLIVYNLEFSTQYLFIIDGVSPTFKSPSNRNFNLGPYTGPTCETTFVTGPACPAINSEVTLVTAPYPNSVYVSVPADIFTSPTLLHNITFITGVDRDCSHVRITDPPYCYLAKFYTINEFNELANQSFHISTQPTCNQSDYCDIEFVMDKNYYITILGQSECGSVVSHTLRINIPSPFPLGIVVGVTVSVVVLLVIVLLGIILFKSLKEIREMHYDELKNSMEEENHIKQLQTAKNEIVSMSL